MPMRFTGVWRDDVPTIRIDETGFLWKYDIQRHMPAYLSLEQDWVNWHHYFIYMQPLFLNSKWWGKRILYPYLYNKKERYIQWEIFWLLRTWFLDVKDQKRCALLLLFLFYSRVLLMYDIIFFLFQYRTWYTKPNTSYGRGSCKKPWFVWPSRWCFWLFWSQL